MMGGEFGDEDERVITRLENNQYDSSAVPTNGLDENDDFGAGLGGPPNGGQQQQPQSNQQPNQSPLNQPPQQINPSPSNPMNNGQQPGQWSGPSPHNQAGVNGNNNSNPPSIGPSSIEDKKPSPISQ